ncbi:hypothetical protein [Nonomuraea dietziae]|uniref:hypothetical protein n=1 Tax=Nonomuraea dietziae TaxID=65515 RepID=UPI0031D5AA8A
MGALLALTPAEPKLGRSVPKDAMLHRLPAAHIQWRCHADHGDLHGTSQFQQLMLETFGLIRTVRTVDAHICEHPQAIEDVVRDHPIRYSPTSQYMTDDRKRVFDRIVSQQGGEIGVAHVAPTLYDPLNGLLTCCFTDPRLCTLRHVNSVLTLMIIQGADAFI